MSDGPNQYIFSFVKRKIKNRLQMQGCYETGEIFNCPLDNLNS